MKIFINADTFKEIALKAKDDLIRYLQELDIEIASGYQKRTFFFQ